MELVAQTECAHCGVLVSTIDVESVFVMLTDQTAFVYHPWCWEDAKKRVIWLLPRYSRDELEAVMNKEGEPASTNDVVDVAKTVAAVDQPDTEATTQSD